MFKLFYKVLIMLSITVVSLLVLSNCFMTKYEPTVPNYVKYVNTGSSHGVHSFLWENQKVSANLGLSSQSLFYDYQVVKHYIDTMDEETVLAIPISYFSLFYNQYGVEDSFITRNEIYYDFLNANQIARVDIAKYIIKHYIPIINIGDNNMGSIFKTITPPISNEATEITSLEEIGRLRAKFHKDLIETANGSYEINSESYNYLKKLIELTKEKGIKVVLVTTPYLSYYNKEWSNEFYDSFYHNIDELCEEYKLPYLDYSHDERFENEPRLFRENDTDHLNTEGSKEFTKIFIEDVNKIKFE